MTNRPYNQSVLEIHPVNRYVHVWKFWRWFSTSTSDIIRWSHIKNVISCIIIACVDIRRFSHYVRAWYRWKCSPFLAQRTKVEMNKYVKLNSWSIKQGEKKSGSSSPFLGKNYYKSEDIVKNKNGAPKNNAKEKFPRLNDDDWVISPNSVKK